MGWTKEFEYFAKWQSNKDTKYDIPFFLIIQLTVIDTRYFCANTQCKDTAKVADCALKKLIFHPSIMLRMLTYKLGRYPFRNVALPKRK